jgi:hypothetical protein
MTTVIAMAVVTVKPQTAGDVGTGHKADHAAGDEANGAADKGARGRAECAVEHPLPGACRSRRQQRRGNECDHNDLSHDSLIPSRDDDRCQMSDVRC